MVSSLPGHLYSFSLCSFLIFSLGLQFLHRLVEEFISVSIKGRWPDPFLPSLTGLELPSLFSTTTDVAITAKAGHSSDLMWPGNDFQIGSNRQPCSFMGLPSGGTGVQALSLGCWCEAVAHQEPGQIDSFCSKRKSNPTLTCRVTFGYPFVFGKNKKIANWV